MKQPADPPRPTQRAAPSIRLDRGALAERRRRERRVWLWGLAGSVVLHALAVLLFWNVGAPTPSGHYGPPEPIVISPPAGTRVIDVVEVADSEEPDAEPTPTAPPVAPARADAGAAPPDSAGTAVAASRGREAADERTAADRLAPRLVDPRLWYPVVILPGEPTLEDVERRVGAALELLSDSALAEAERHARSLDWTVEDAEGGKWGISPGKLHLGKLTLPLPIAFAVNDKLTGRAAEWYEFRAWSERAAIVESFETRVKAIRERRDRERSERRTAENGGGGGGGGGSD